MLQALDAGLIKKPICFRAHMARSPFTQVHSRLTGPENRRPTSGGGIRASLLVGLLGEAQALDLLGWGLVLLQAAQQQVNHALLGGITLAGEVVDLAVVVL